MADHPAIDELTGDEFEEFVAGIFRRMGFSVEKSPVGPDGGIDLVAHSDDVITGGKYVIQCKRTAAPVSEPVLRDLFGVVASERAVKGVLVTNSSFTRPCREFAEGKPLQLIDGDALRDLAYKHNVMDERAATPAAPPHLDLLCRRLDQALNPIWSEYDGVLSGHIAVGHKKYGSEKTYVNFLSQTMTEAGELVHVFGRVTVEALNRVLQKGTEVSSNEVMTAAGRLAAPVKRLLGLRKSLAAVTPPNRFDKAHTCFVTGFDECLAGARDLHEQLLAVRDEPTSAANENNQVHINANLSAPSLVRANKELDKALKQSSCAVVTACFGDEEASEVVTMRNWRDCVLVRTSAGRYIIAMYSVGSPPIAGVFRRIPFLAALGRRSIRVLLRRGFFNSPRD